MDVATVDSQYQLLEQETQQTVQSLQLLATKMQGADQSGDANAKEWLLDLRNVALQVQQEQLQMQSLLQALHGFAVNALQQAQPGTAAVQPTATQPAVSANQPGNTLQNFMGSGFGRAIEMGAGFGLANQLIGSIFG